MPKLTVELDNDHLARQLRGPAVGLTELIWNSLDADANNIHVAVLKNELDAPIAVVLTDDGHGMNTHDVNAGFGALGGSWKKRNKLSKEQRRHLHGEQGKGRFAAFGLGERISWRSIAEDVDGTLKEIEVTGSRSSLRNFDISTPVPVSEGRGTQVTIDSLTERAVQWLSRADSKDNLATTFAMYLESYPRVTIKYCDETLDPTSMQEHREEYLFDAASLLEKHDVTDPVSMVVIEWNRTIDRAIYLCDSDGMASATTLPKIQAPGQQFTAYLKWSGFRGHDSLLAEMEEPASSIIDLARDKLRDHFKRRALERQRAVIENWINEGVYPYPAGSRDGDSSLQTAERQIFDIVAYTASSAINQGEKPAKKLSLRLLREAVETNPGELHHVLNSVLELPKEQLKDLSGLLERTSLSSIINTSKQIADRLNFLIGLDSILFDPDPRRETKERRELHRILVNETWIFGEEYALTGDDEPLTKVLVKHLKALGEDVEIADVAPVLRLDGSNPIPDLVLSQRCEIAQDRVENLVVELKRPSVRIGADEIQQIEKYAIAVMNDERFQQPNVRWDFWIIGNSIDKYAETRRSQVGLPYGYIQRTDNHSIQVRTWAEVINDARHRLKFVEKSLDYQASNDSGIKYLRQTHAKYLPPSLADDNDVDNTSEDVAEAS